ncbi:TasA family protein [Erysipelotrichaceae bacterium HCN-30851]
MNKKKLTTLVGSLALVGVIGVGASLAYFSDQDAATNVFTMGNIDIELTETGSNADGSSPIMTEDGIEFTKEIMPGDTVNKAPVVTVDADSEISYLRASISVGDIEGAKTLDTTHKADIMADLTRQLNANGWYLGTDGYFYLTTANDNGVATPGDYTLFQTVTFPTTWGNEVKNARFTIQIQVYAVQADNFEVEYDGSGHITSWVSSVDFN